MKKKQKRAGLQRVRCMKTYKASNGVEITYPLRAKYVCYCSVTFRVNGSCCLISCTQEEFKQAVDKGEPFELIFGGSYC